MERRLVPVGDERQGRAGQQLLELVGAQHVAAEVGLPHSRARPGRVQQRGLTRHQASVLGKETGAVLPVTLLLPDTPELLPAGQRVEVRGRRDREEEAGVEDGGRSNPARPASDGLLLTSRCRRGSSGSGRTPAGGCRGSPAAPPWSPRW